jgi:hypothetical protein
MLPLGAQTGRAPLKPWLDAVADDLSRQNVQSVLLFVCGPAALVQSAQQAACDTTSLVDWRLHVERFEFLAAQKGEATKVNPTDAAAAIINENVLGKSHAWHAFNAPSQQDMPQSPHSLERGDPDRIVAVFHRTSSKYGESGLRQQQTPSSVWMRSGELAEAAEGHHQSSLGFDWNASNGPILAADHVPNTVEGKEDADRDA